jgi:RNA polymerase sigma-70 factor (ECF subfamily)
MVLNLYRPAIHTLARRENRLPEARSVPEDAVLLAQARVFDPQALAHIHNSYYPPLYRYIMLRVSDREIAEDLTSEVFTRLLAALRKGTAPQSTLRGWLYGVAANVVADHQRAAYRVTHTELDETVVSSSAGPAERIEAALTREALLNAVQDLTDDQQQVIALRYGSELPFREVAETMGKSEGAVKQLLARAVTRLSKTMQPMVEGGG